MNFQPLVKRTCQNLKKSNKKKSEILASLSNEKFLSLVEFQKTNSNRSSLDAEPLRIWDQIIAVMQNNRKLHQRNEVLVNTKLESIRNAIKTLGTNDPQSSVEIYDKLGKIKGSKYLIINPAHALLINHPPPGFRSKIINHLPLGVSFFDIMDAITSSSHFSV